MVKKQKKEFKHVEVKKVIRVPKKEVEELLKKSKKGSYMKDPKNWYVDKDGKKRLKKKSSFDSPGLTVKKEGKEFFPDKPKKKGSEDEVKTFVPPHKPWPKEKLTGWDDAAKMLKGVTKAKATLDLTKIADALYKPVKNPSSFTHDQPVKCVDPTKHIKSVKSLPLGKQQKRPTSHQLHTLTRQIDAEMRMLLKRGRFDDAQAIAVAYRVTPKDKK